MSAPASAVIETTVTVPALIGIPGPQGATGPVGPPGTQTFTVAGNSGPSQTIGNGDTLTLTSPVSFQQVVMSAVDTATFEWPNQTGNVFLASPANGSAGTPDFRAITFADLDAVLGTMAQQDANAVAITGGTMSAVAITLGTINNAPIGGTTPAAITGTQITATTGVTLPDGTAGTPSLNFTNNTNMGMYRFGAGEIGFSIGGNVAMQLNSVGLGLGTTAAVKLDLSSASATTIRVRTTTANNAQIHFIRTGIAEYAIGYNNSDTSFRIANNATVGTNDRVIISTAGVFTHNETDAGTNNTVTTLILQRNSTGTPAANFASRTLWQLESSTTENRDAAAIDVLWTTATDATRTSRMDFYTVSSGTTTNVAQLSAAGFQAPFGLFNAPGLTFVGDTDTGIYRSSSDVLAFTTGASTRFTLSNNGLIATVNGSFTYSDGGTNDTQTVFVIGRSSSSTPAANFASRMIFNLESSTTDNTNAANIITSWVVATHASRTARQVFNIFDTAAREAMRLEASGSAPMIGFLGANAIVRPTVTGSRGGNAALASLLTEIANLGLIVDNTTA